MVPAVPAGLAAKVSRNGMQHKSLDGKALQSLQRSRSTPTLCHQTAKTTTPAFQGRFAGLQLWQLLVFGMSAFHIDYGHNGNDLQLNMVVTSSLSTSEFQLCGVQHVVLARLCVEIAWMSCHLSRLSPECRSSWLPNQQRQAKVSMGPSSVTSWR